MRSFAGGLKQYGPLEKLFIMEVGLFGSKHIIIEADWEKLRTMRKSSRWMSANPEICRPYFRPIAGAFTSPLGMGYTVIKLGFT
jgi:hypothetical protein